MTGKKTTYEPKPERLAFAPQQVGAYAVQYAERIQQNKASLVYWPLPLVDEYFAPLAPGQVAALIGQPSNGKSFFIAHWERKEAKKIKPDAKEIILHIDTEEPVENQAFSAMAGSPDFSLSPADILLGRVPKDKWRDVLRAAVEVGKLPIYRIGESLQRRDAPPLYLSNIQRAINYLMKDILGGEYKVRAVFLDYLQALPIDPAIKQEGYRSSRRLQVREDFYRLRKMAGDLGCPVIVGVQAKQTLAGAPHPNLPLPGYGDGEETFAITQRADAIATMCRPITTLRPGMIDAGSITYEVTETAFWFKAAKRRGPFPAGRSWLFQMDFEGLDFVPDERLHGAEYRAWLMRRASEKEETEVII